MFKLMGRKINTVLRSYNFLYLDLCWYGKQQVAGHISPKLKISRCRIFFNQDLFIRPLNKSANSDNNFLIFQPIHMLWVLKRTISMHPKQMLSLTNKKIFLILCSKHMLIWINVYPTVYIRSNCLFFDKS